MAAFFGWTKWTKFITVNEHLHYIVIPNNIMIQIATTTSGILKKKKTSANINRSNHIANKFYTNMMQVEFGYEAVLLSKRYQIFNTAI